MARPRKTNLDRKLESLLEDIEHTREETAIMVAKLGFLHPIDRDRIIAGLHRRCDLTLAAIEARRKDIVELPGSKPKRRRNREYA
jgi:hypothetical protein